jgi:hypothetical protein
MSSFSCFVAPLWIQLSDMDSDFELYLHMVAFNLIFL